MKLMQHPIELHDATFKSHKRKQFTDMQLLALMGRDKHERGKKFEWNRLKGERALQELESELRQLKDPDMYQDLPRNKFYYI